MVFPPSVVMVCSRCGFVLYNDISFRSGSRVRFVSPSSIVRLYRRCPSCGKELSVRGGKLVFMSLKEFNERYGGLMSLSGYAVITFRVPVWYLVFLDSLVSRGVFKNRSEAIREALRLLFESFGL